MWPVGKCLVKVKQKLELWKRKYEVKFSSICQLLKKPFEFIHFVFKLDREF